MRKLGSSRVQTQCTANLAGLNPWISFVNRFDERVEEFLLNDKQPLDDVRWQSKPRGDYAEARVRLAVVDRPQLSGQLILTAHKYRIPHKFSFAMLFYRERVFALDVEPGMRHLNRDTLQSVYGMHWQRWPSMNAIADTRSLTHYEWFRIFFDKARIVNVNIYAPPPLDSKPEIDQVP